MDQTLTPKYSGAHTATPTNDGMAIQQEDRIHTLNCTATEIFELCNGARTIGDIRREMHTRYTEEEVETEVENFLLQLRESGLIHLS